MEAAKAYSELNKPLYDIGVDFIRTLDISKGDKVLDMGCGTGEVTKFIADIVGGDGEVVAVDPDEAMIKVAREKFKDVQNIKFLVGDSVAGFSHDNDQFYDLHFSNHVFRLVRGDEKKVYLQKAYQCLKPGGRVAMLTVLRRDTKVEQQYAHRVEPFSEEQFRELFRSVGLFTDVVMKKVTTVTHFASFDELKAFVVASSKGTIRMEDLEPDALEEFMSKGMKEEADGTWTMEVEGVIHVTGKKET